MSFKTKRLVLALTAGTSLIAGSFASSTSAWATSPASDVATPVKKSKRHHHKKHVTQQQAATSTAVTPAPIATAPAVEVSANADQKPDTTSVNLEGQKVSTAASPKDDPKGTQAPEYNTNNRPRQSLGAVESQRVDRLTGKAAWENKENFRIHDLFALPTWVDLSLEDRIRYEDYSTPWRGGAPSKQSYVGQEALVNQLVVWSEARFSDQWRAGFEFWDARQWGGPGAQTHAKNGAVTTQGYVDALNSSTVNTGQFAQIYGAYVGKNLFDLKVDGETKFGQMTMDLGSRRLIGRAAYRNTQQQYVGVQQRLRDGKGDWELTAFANVPEILYPGTPTPQNYKSSYNTGTAMTNDVIWNRPQTNAYFTGALFQKNIIGDHKADLGLFYLNEGPENILNRRLFTPSIRFYKPNRKGEINYEVETIGQTGTAVNRGSTANLDENFYAPKITGKKLTNGSGNSSGYQASQNVGGLFQHIHFGYTFDTDFDPRLTAQWDYGTSHFDTLYGPTVFEYGPTGIGGFFATRTNINSPGWKFEFVPHRDVTVYINQRWWWMADAMSTSGWAGSNIYNVGTGANQNYQGSYIGETIELNARWDAHSNVAFQAGWQVLMKGDLATKGTGAVGVGYTSYNGQLSSNYFSGGNQYNGSNVNLFYTQMQVRF